MMIMIFEVQSFIIINLNNHHKNQRSNIFGENYVSNR